MEPAGHLERSLVRLGWHRDEPGGCGYASGDLAKGQESGRSQGEFRAGEGEKGKGKEGADSR